MWILFKTRICSRCIRNTPVCQNQSCWSSSFVNQFRTYKYMYIYSKPGVLNSLQTAYPLRWKKKSRYNRFKFREIPLNYYMNDVTCSMTNTAQHIYIFSKIKLGHKVQWDDWTCFAFINSWFGFRQIYTEVRLYA